MSRKTASILFSFLIPATTPAVADAFLLSNEKPVLRELLKLNLNSESVYSCPDNGKPVKFNETKPNLPYSYVQCERDGKRFGPVLKFPKSGEPPLAIDSVSLQIGNLTHWRISKNDSTQFLEFNENVFCEYAMSKEEIKTCKDEDWTKDSCQPKRTASNSCIAIPKKLVPEADVFSQAFVTSAPGSTKPGRVESIQLGTKRSLVFLKDWIPRFEVKVVGTFSDDDKTFKPNANAGASLATQDNRKWLELENNFALLEDGKILIEKSENFLAPWIKKNFGSEEKLIEFLAVPAEANEDTPAEDFDDISDFVWISKSSTANRASFEFKHPKCFEFKAEDCQTSSTFLCKSVKVDFDWSGKAFDMKKQDYRIRYGQCENFDP